MRKKAVFLDRDGTINFDPGYLRKASEFKLLPGAREALIALQNAGYLLIVVSNQSGVGRGIILPDDLDEIHRTLNVLIAPAKIDAFYFCTHLPDAGCDCRKPATRWAQVASRDLGVDLASSVMVGDRESDVMFGVNAKIGTSVLVLTGHGQENVSLVKERSAHSQAKILIAEDLAAATQLILGT